MAGFGTRPAIHLTAIGALVASLCAPGGVMAQTPAPAPSQAGAVSFRAHVQPLLNTYCVTCHIADSAPAGLDLQPGHAYRALVGVRSTQSALNLVEPGSAKASYVLYKLRGRQADVGGKGNAMPFGEAEAAPVLIDALERWVAAGALNN
jgi:hypothetical protein